jgi:hypothetical protein
MKSLISLIHSLGVKVAADGIENGRQAERMSAADVISPREIISASRCLRSRLPKCTGIDSNQVLRKINAIFIAETEFSYNIVYGPITELQEIQAI